jgi:hypothetical protein
MIESHIILANARKGNEARRPTGKFWQKFAGNWMKIRLQMTLLGKPGAP